MRKWGNSLALRIPEAFAKEAQVDQGSVADLSVEEGRLVAVPRKKPIALKDLLTGVTRSKLHGEPDMGKPVGREIV